MNENINVTERGPTTRAFVKTYIDELTISKAKSPLTIRKEASALKGWSSYLGKTPLNFIRPHDVQQYIVMRSQSVTPRTVNLDVLALSNLLQHARKMEIIDENRALITERFKPLKYVPARRSLITGDQLQALVTEARSFETCDEQPVPGAHILTRYKYQNGEELADLILFMAYSGARREAALTAKWENVDWQNKQVTLFTKYDKKVVVDFNPKLESHLIQTYKHSIEYPPKGWIFPSPTGEGHWVNPGPCKDKICAAIGIPDFRFHDCRHYFISHAIMAGVDTLTVASWVGHADGGVLIGKVYGHLDPKHRRSAAEKLTF